MHKGGLYLALGDSTACTHVSTGANFYASITSANIAKNYGEVAHRNLAYSGLTTTDWMIDRYVMGYQLEPNLVTVGFGMNDSSTSENVPLATFTSNLQVLVDHFRHQNPDVTIILCSPNTVKASATFTTESALAPYRAAMDTVAANYTSGVVVCHFENAWTQANAASYIDSSDSMGIHPGDAGHQALANLLWTTIQAKAASWLASLK